MKRPYGSASWESNFTQLEAALSLGLFGDKSLEYKLNGNRPRDEDQKKSKEDWLRSSENMQRKERSVRLLGPSTTVALRDLTWWIGPQKRKLREISLRTDKDKGVEIGAYWIAGFGSSETINEASFSVEPYRIAGSWDAVDDSALEHYRQERDSPSKRWCFAAISEADVGLLYAQHMFSTFMHAIAKEEAVTEFSKAAIEKKWKFIPSQSDSWNSIQLSEKKIEDLALCVQRAGLADLEDAFLSIIAPLSKEAKLPSLEEIFDAGWESAIHEQSQEQWRVAKNVVHLLWKTFVTSSKHDEMAVRTTAVVMEFLRLFYRKLQSALAEAPIEDGDRPPSLWDMENAYYSIKEMLQTADEDVLSSLLDLFAMEGWPEVQDKPPRPPRDHQRKTIRVDTILQLTDAHDAALKGDFRALGYWIRRDQSSMGKDLFGRTFLHYLVKKRGELEISSEEFKTVVQPMLKCIDDRDRYGMTALHSAAERAGSAMIPEVSIPYQYYPILVKY
jgi:hypothetical protein